MRLTMHIMQFQMLLMTSIAGILLQSVCATAAEYTLERISINEDWRFHKYDVKKTADDLIYDVRPEVNNTKKDVVADEMPTEAVEVEAKQPILKPWILPTGNDFIKDPAKRHIRPDENPGGDFPYVQGDFNDRSWERVNLPHDWAINGPFQKGWGAEVNGGMGRLPSPGVAWYRKKLDIPMSDNGKSIFLDVDGAMSYSMVWLNGNLVGGWPYGYASWRVDLTPYVKPGGENQLAIRLDNPNNSSRWYPGGGIYRNVWLTKTNPIHVAQWGTFVTTPDVSKASATINLEVTIDNDSKDNATVRVVTQIFALNSDGNKIGDAVTSFQPLKTQVAAGKSAKVEGSAILKNPKLWGPPPTQIPNRYVAVTTLLQNNKLLDKYETYFGIRLLRFDPKTGVYVNNELIKIKGVNQHHDLGALGAAFNIRAAERQLEILREMGCNAIRTSHNPPAPEFLELTDRMGFLVMDEIFDVWERKKTSLDFHLIFPEWYEQDMRAFVRRDRNHPSVIIWSFGNEVGEQYTGEEGAAVAKQLYDIVKDEDPTRLTTSAMNWAKPDMPLPDVMDVISLNYQGEGSRDALAYSHLEGIRTPPLYSAFHEKFRDKVILSTENAAALSSRGTYFFPVYEGISAPVRDDGAGGDPKKQYVSAYELYTSDFGSSADKVFASLDKHPYVAGGFVWSGWDYLGEPTPYYSARSSYFGIIDLAGFKKDRFYLYQAHWRQGLPMAHILPHWNWPERVGEITPVHVFTSGDEAELFLNGKSLGRKKKGQYEYRLRWDEVKYEPGELKVIAYKDGKEWATDIMSTAGKASKIVLQPDRATINADGLDLSFITVTIQDNNGITVPTAKNLIRFSVSGPAEIVATDNGDPTDFDSFSSHGRKAFNGLALVIVRAKPGRPGIIELKAESDSLQSATFTLQSTEERANTVIAQHMDRENVSKLKPGENPIIRDIFTADPAPLVYRDTVYLYAGHDNAKVGQFFTMPDWLCYSSKDMKTWTPHGSIMRPEEFKFARADVAWAAQVVPKDGKYYFYVTLRRNNNNEHCIGVAVGDSPIGPFKDARGTPLITDGMTTDSRRPNADIDPTVFIDDDGTAWLAWGNGDCYLAKLKPNMTELDGPIKKLDITPYYSEGPWLFKRGELYYNVFAVDVPGTQPEQIGYATAPAVEGPWTYRGLVTGPAKVGFTIHPAVIEFKGQWYFFYHDGSNRINDEPGGDCRRSVCVEYLEFNDDGTIKPITQTKEGISRNAESPKQSIQLFPLKDVRLLESSFSEAVKANRQYLLAHDPDRLLAPFRREAGMEPKARSYGNWESGGLDGHTAGHYLSALSLMMASGADPDGEFRRRLDYMIDELEQIQKANGNGYLGGIPGSKDYWKSVADGHVELMRNKWAPWYNLHKMFAGLRDAYIHGGNKKAFDLLVGFGDWCEKVTSGLTDQQMQQMIGTEYGGMNEVLADIYAITGDKKYIELAKRFNHRAIFEPLENHEDRLTGLHANTQIPKIIGMERIAALVGDEKLHTGAQFFWETVTQNRSVAFGGNSVSEHFNDPKDFSGMVAHREGPETCNTYNMLRLTEALFTAEPKAAYADFYERALYNHILASINPKRPGYVYFTPLRPDHYRVYSQPEQAFWCCVGTGMENPGRYGEFIYVKSKDGVYVNLFIPSEVTVSDDGMVLKQETKFPDEAKTHLSIKLEKPTTFTLNIRHPVWCDAGDFAVKVNGRYVDVMSTPSSYAAIRREWKNGDKIEVSLPMRTTIERLPDGSNWVAILHGPIVLANPDGTDNMDGLFANDGRMAHVANGPMIPLDKVPVLLTTEEELLSHVVPDSSAGPLNFRIMDVIEPAEPKGLPLVPFFRLHERRYQMYWELTTPEHIAVRKEKLAAEERARAARETATIDSIAVGEQQSEVEHDLKGEGMESGIHNGRRWRHGALIQYTLDPRGAREAILAVTYSGDDRGREFDILVNGTIIATQQLTGENPNHFIEKRYPIPSDILQTAGNDRLTVRFAAKQWLAGGLYDVRLLKPDAPVIQTINIADPAPLTPIPAVPTPQAQDSVPMGDEKSFPEMKLDIPVAPGPFEPTWESIEKNYPGEPAWLREAKFGIWVHFGPQSAGESGDWYARRLYSPGERAYRNHLRKYGHPLEVGYKEVLRDWNPTKLDPTALTKIYHDAGARFLMIQGVHHDNFDLWNSHYQPWNSVNLGPKRDLIGEWAKACRADGMRFGVTFHHEYTWWWWQTAFGSDNEGDKKGVPYDGNLTLADGKGKWWEGYDPRLLYGINLREYKGVTKAAYSGWSPPPAGIFSNHLAYAKWYATQWALRIMDVVDQYDPDFIYTDGTVQQPFSGNGTGTGLKADAMQRVIADFYNHALQRRGQVDTFSIVKFRHKTNGTVTTEEFGVPADINTNQPWIAEAPVGDWFYAPGLTYDSGMMIRYVIEAVTRDGNAALCISILPDGSLDEGSQKMLKEVGVWMRRNGEAVYGSRAWTIPGEGEQVNGKLKMLPGGKLERRHADFKFGPQDFRFTIGKNGVLYAFCMTVPAPGTQLKIKSLGTDAKYFGQPVKTVKLLGHGGELQWKQETDGLAITCPAEMPFATSITFKIE